MGKDSGNIFVTEFIVKVVTIFAIVLIVLIGAALGLSLAMTANTKNNENFVEFAPALPTRIYDINGTLITEFSADEKRELVVLSELPRHLIHAVLAREDPDFFNHRGFSIRGIARAFMGQISGNYKGGGSTITQQVAGTLYTDRREKTIKRKVKELWWAFQVERRYTKNEILEIYLNYMAMGPGTYGVEAASKYFFDRSSKEVTLAESAILAVLLSSPTRFNPLSRPNETMDRQQFVLDRMIEFGYTTREEADASFNEYWNNFDYTREAVSAYYNRQDKAPWFSEYVRRELDVLLYGSMDYYRDGYSVHTTLDLRHQEAAEKFVAEGLARANRHVSMLNNRNNIQAERTYLPIVQLLTLVFDLQDVSNASAGKNEANAISRYTKNINPVVDMMALSLGIPELKDVTNKAFANLKAAAEVNMVEGALICIENETGYITAIVGGSKFDESNQLIRASQASVQTGSAFKPLYYSAAIDSRKLTASTLIYDMPMVFYNEDNTPYLPNNYGGAWKGSVLLYDALSQSLNVPALKILETIGFDAAIERAAALLDYSDPAQIRRLFPRYYPLGLGINSTSPLRMARAFGVFGNQGRSITPIAIRTIEDRNGKVIMDIERDVRQKQRRMGNNIQVISPQNAYVMTRIMERALDGGTLSYGSGRGSKFVFTDEKGNNFRMPVAGKTGTTQNWSDAWSVGYTPYYSTAVWYGFDKPGNSLGVDLSGAILAGPVWGDFMREAHMGLPRKEFIRPSGVIDVTVCRRSGMLRTPACNEREVTLQFLEGTQPRQYCEYHGGSSPEVKINVSASAQLGAFGDDDVFSTLTMPTLPVDLIPELRDDPPQSRNNRSATRTNQNQRGSNTNRNRQQQSDLFNNPYLDDDLPASTRNSEAIPGNSRMFPDTAAQFEPNTDSSNVNADEDDNNELPSWNPLD